MGKALKGLRIAARGWRASRLPRVRLPAGDNPARVAQNPAMPGVCAALTGLGFKLIRIPGVAPAAQPRAVYRNPFGVPFLRICHSLITRKKVPCLEISVGESPERVAQNPAMPGVCAALTGLIFKPIRIPGVAPAAQPRSVYRNPFGVPFLRICHSLITRQKVPCLEISVGDSPERAS